MFHKLLFEPPIGKRFEFSSLSHGSLKIQSQAERIRVFQTNPNSRVQPIEVSGEEQIEVETPKVYYILWLKRWNSSLGLPQMFCFKNRNFNFSVQMHQKKSWFPTKGLWQMILKATRPFTHSTRFVLCHDQNYIMHENIFVCFVLPFHKEKLQRNFLHANFNLVDQNFQIQLFLEALTLDQRRSVDKYF